MSVFSTYFFSLVVGGIWLYTTFLLVWYGLHRFYGDQIWWLALISPFAIILLMPILPLWPISIVLIAKEDWQIILPTILTTVVATAFLGKQFRIQFPRIDCFRNNDQSTKTELCSSGSQDNRHTFSFMTFNCWWQSQPTVTTDVSLLNQQPDVVLLQELMPAVAKQMNEALAEDYPYRAFVTSEAVTASRLGVLSRYPLETIPSHHLAALNFRIQIVRLILPLDRSNANTGNKTNPEHTSTILVYNVHPRATNVMRFWREGGRFSHKVSHSFTERYHFIKNMIQDIQQRDEPVIIAGDFNSTPLSDVYRLMCNSFNDSHIEAGQYMGNTFPVHTHDLSRLPIPWPIMRLDMIFSTPTLKCIATHVGHHSGESDHLPVLATFRYGSI